MVKSLKLRVVLKRRIKHLEIPESRTLRAEIAPTVIVANQIRAGCTPNAHGRSTRMTSLT